MLIGPLRLFSAIANRSVASGTPIPTGSDLEVRCRVRLDVTNHVEVVVVNVDDLNRFAVTQRVRNGVADDGRLVEVDRALVVCVVQLGWTDQG